jgi:hypothetical protein
MPFAATTGGLFRGFALTQYFPRLFYTGENTR